MIRVLDCFLSIFGLAILSPLLLLIALGCWFDTRSPIFFQRRVGKACKVFILIKFRTMKIETQEVATHLLDHSKITPFGFLLRKYKLDELPQLWNVLSGDMSFVGPRPCLESQTELIEIRKRFNVFSVHPGITGLAQLKNVNMSDPAQLAHLDNKMLENLGTFEYFSYIFLTLFKLLRL